MKRGQKCPLFYFEKLKKELHLHVPKFKRLYHLSKASYTILNEGLQTDRITTYASIDDNSMTGMMKLIKCWNNLAVKISNGQD